MKFATRGALIRLLALVALLVALPWWFLIRTPGRSFEGAPGAVDAALVAELKRDVGQLGERNVFQPRGLEAAAAWIEAELRAAGYAPAHQEYEVNRTPCGNIEAEIDSEIVIVGAHYTAPFRYPHYHKPTDTPDRLDYDGLACVVLGLVPVVAALAGVGPP